MTDDEKLTELEGRASKGPWAYERDMEGSSMGWIGHETPAGQSTVFQALFDVCGDSAQQAINAELIVAMRNALPALLTELHTLRQRNARLVEGLRDLVSLLEYELQDRADDSLSEEDLIAWLGKEYGRHTIACRIRLAQSRTLIEDNPNG